MRDEFIRFRNYKLNRVALRFRILCVSAFSNSPCMCIVLCKRCFVENIILPLHDNLFTQSNMVPIAFSSRAEGP